MNEPWWSAEAKRRFELQSYEPRPTIDGVEFVELTRHADDGGSMTELLRLDGSIPQSLRDLSIRQAIPNLMGLILFYPAVANDLRDLLGADAFSPRARQIRKAELPMREATTPTTARVSALPKTNGRARLRPPVFFPSA